MVLCALEAEPSDSAPDTKWIHWITPHMVWLFLDYQEAHECSVQKDKKVDSSEG
jgi:hypothetical protein